MARSTRLVMLIKYIYFMGSETTPSSSPSLLCKLLTEIIISPSLRCKLLTEIKSRIYILYGVGNVEKLRLKSLYPLQGYKTGKLQCSIIVRIIQFYRIFT